jgi:microsomal dipeptidase-like Zn-dependent dipeptidase
MSTDSIPIIDLHCDLLGCVEQGKGKYTFDSPELNCSVPQLIAGNVSVQVLAIAAITLKDSSAVGQRQLALYDELLARDEDLRYLFAIENASALLSEEEELPLFFKRLEKAREVEDVVYISLTWNQENRFGGGNLTDVGLKEDGKAVLEYLDGKQIAIDFSHTSDALAYDILDFIEKKSVAIPVMASHSNYRAICQNDRNLPEEIAKEIIRRDGLIGLNFVRRFVGKTPDAFLDHIDYALSIGGEEAICLGADFYGALDVSPNLCPGKTDTTFFPEFANSSCYPGWIELLRTRFPENLIKNICFRNANKVLESYIAL